MGAVGAGVVGGCGVVEGRGVDVGTCKVCSTRKLCKDVAIRLLQMADSGRFLFGNETCDSNRKMQFSCPLNVFLVYAPLITLDLSLARTHTHAHTHTHTRTHAPPPTPHPHTHAHTQSCKNRVCLCE